MQNNLRRVYEKMLAGAAVLVMLAAASGCQPAPDASALPTLVPTIAILSDTQAAPTTAAVPAVEATAYPPFDAYPGVEEAGGEEAGVEQAGGDYPVEPMLGPVVENRATVRARLIEQAPDERPGYTLLRVEILESQDIAGMQNFTRSQLNQEVDMLVETGQMPALEPGENLTAEVTYRGDESGGIFFAAQVEKANP